MAKLTSDLQVSVPEALPMIRRPSRSIKERLELFDQATERQREREARRPAEPVPADRGWTREELYDRARPR